MPGFAPIGLFAYNRPEHLARALRALSRCKELADSQLTIFCDGPKPTADGAVRARIAETREIAGELAPQANVIERAENFGLAKSIRTGVTALTEAHGRAIILEDDLEVSSTFLAFMNTALDRYADEPSAMQVSGYQYPVEIRGGEDAMFVPSISCWGWGVWQRSWTKLGTGADHFAKLARDPAARRRFDLDDAYPYFEMLQAQHRGEIDSWGIAWNLDVFANNGLVLYPRTSLVANRGHDGSGAHQEVSNPFEADAHDFMPTKWPVARVDDAQLRQLYDFIRRANRGSLRSRVGRLLRRAKVKLTG